MNIEFLFVSFLVPIIFASDNGKYYICDTTILNSDNKCIFALSGDQPAEWIQETVEHDISRSVGADFYREVYFCHSFLFFHIIIYSSSSLKELQAGNISNEKYVTPKYSNF